MRTITIEKTLYKFDELSDKAKQAAKDKHAAIMGYAWRREALASIEKLADHFDGKVHDYNIDWFNRFGCSMSFMMPEMGVELIQERLSQLGTFNPETLEGHGDCKLTGYCHDESAIDGFRKAFMRDGYQDLGRLMNRAFKSWIDACCADCDDQYSDEQFSETCDANEYEFLENG